MEIERQYCIYCRRILHKNKRRKNQWHISCHKSVYGSKSDIIFEGEILYKRDYQILLELRKEIYDYSIGYRLVKLSNLIHMFENFGYVISNKSVIGLDLKHQLRSPFYKFINLQTLYLTHFKEISSDISKLKQLKKLIIKHSTLTKIPDQVGNLPKLEHLEITGITRITDLPDSIGKFKNLKTFILAPINETTKITKLPESMNQLKNLEYFYLSGTAISELPLGFENLTNLQELYILSRSITNIPLLMNFKNLKIFECQAKIDGIPASFSDLTELEELKLYNNKVQILPEISKLKKLTKIEIFNTEITHLPLGLSNLHRLKTLSVYQTPLRSLPENIFKLQALKNIDFSQSELTKLPQKFTFPELKKLNLERTFITTLPEDIFLPLLEELRISCFMKGIEKILSLRILHITNTLPGKELEEFPTEIFQLHNLVSLDIGTANFTKIPNNFESLSKLRMIYLHKTQIRSIQGIPEYLQDKMLLREIVVYVHPDFNFKGIKDIVNLRIKY